MADSSSAETSEDPGEAAVQAAVHLAEAAARALVAHHPDLRPPPQGQRPDRDPLPAAVGLPLSRDPPAGPETPEGKPRLSLTTTATTGGTKAAMMCGMTPSATDRLAAVAEWAQAASSSAAALSFASSASCSAPGSGRDALRAVIGATRLMGSEEVLSAATLLQEPQSNQKYNLKLSNTLSSKLFIVRSNLKPS